MAWLAEQESDLKRQLEESELKLYQYKKDRNLLAVSLDDKQSMLSQNLATVNAKLTELHIKLLELDAKRKMIERARDNIAEEETLPEIREKRDDRRSSATASSSSPRTTPTCRRSTVREHPKMKALTGPDGERPQGLREGDRRRPGVVREVVPGAARQRAVAEGADGAAEEGGHRALEDRGRVQAARSGRPSRKRRCTASSRAGRKRSTSPAR